MSSDGSDNPTSDNESGPPKGPPDGPPGLPPTPAVKKKAPGVRDSRQAPDETMLETGDSVGNRFFVERYLGSSSGGVSYLCNDSQTQDPVVVKVLTMPYPGDAEFGRLRSKIGVASSIDHPNLLGAVGMGRIDAGDIFVAMQYADGSTLSRLLTQRREEGRTLSLRDAFTVLAHTCDALAAVHRRETCHGVLTPYNIYVEPDGSVKVGNLAVGRVSSSHLFEQGEGPFIDSIYVAPEASDHSAGLDYRSDIYSLAMIAAELLSPTGLPNDRKEAKEMAVDALSNYPPALFSLVSGCLSTDPADRLESVEAFREEFEEVARDAGARLQGPPPSGALPIEPAVESETDDGEDDLFDMFDPDELGSPDEDASGEDRYLVQKDGLDYGPFTREEVLEQLYDDEIDEHSKVLDRVTQDRRELQEFDAFRDEVLEYIPKREERLRREAERRAEIKRKAKKGGVAALVVGIVGGLVVLAGMGWFWLQQPDPEPIPMDQAFASMDDYHFSPPPTDFQTMEVDSDVMEGIFNPEATQEEVERQIAEARRAEAAARDTGSGGTAGSGAAAAAAEDEEVTEIDMSDHSGTDHHLSDYEINQVITDDFSAIRDCVMKEARQNPSFDGVTVQFYIRPTGTTGGVELRESQYEGRPFSDCLIDRFRNMRFPEHGAVHERGVEYPIPISGN